MAAIFHPIRRADRFTLVQIENELARWQNDYAEEGEVFSIGRMYNSYRMLQNGNDYGPFFKCQCGSVVFSPNLSEGDGEGECFDCGKFGEVKW